VYFSGVLFSWVLFAFLAKPNANSLAFLSLAAIPFTIYSVIYQRFVVKKWCPLCLATLVVLWIQAISVILFDFENAFAIDWGSTFAVIFGFYLISMIWILLVPKLKLEQDYKKLLITHNRFKNNYNIFNALISRQAKVNTLIKNTSEIILGAKGKDALLKIVLITNPLCGHCKSAHHSIEQLLRKNDHQLQVSLRFNVNIDSGSVDAIIASMLLNIYHTKGEAVVTKALNEVYSSMKQSEWIKKMEY
jgi:hypothetical protein